MDIDRHCTSVFDAIILFYLFFRFRPMKNLVGTISIFDLILSKLVVQLVQFKSTKLQRCLNRTENAFDTTQRMSTLR